MTLLGKVAEESKPNFNYFVYLNIFPAYKGQNTEVPLKISGK
jgi:hypothetical protein